MGQRKHANSDNDGTPYKPNRHLKRQKLPPTQEKDEGPDTEVDSEVAEGDFSDVPNMQSSPSGLWDRGDEENRLFNAPEVDNNSQHDGFGAPNLVEEDSDGPEDTQPPSSPSNRAALPLIRTIQRKASHASTSQILDDSDTLTPAQQARLKFQESIDSRRRAQRDGWEKADKKARQDMAFGHLKEWCQTKDFEGTNRNYHDFFTTLFSDFDDPSDQRSKNISRYLEGHGRELVEILFKRCPELRDVYLETDNFMQGLRPKLEAEGSAIMNIFTRTEGTQVGDLLDNFNLPSLSQQLQTVAPTLWDIFLSVSTPANSTDKVKANRKKTSCAMFSVLRSQKANNFQAVIGLFLLGSGSAKHEIEVLAHAGLSLSYKSILNYVRNLSDEGRKHFHQVFRMCMCSVVWDNLNIAFRVEAQRFDNKNHFDNGTTATLIVVYNPLTGENHTPHQTLPLDFIPPRATTRSVLDWNITDTLLSAQDSKQLDECLRWQLKSIAIAHIPSLKHFEKHIGACPSIEQITPHKTEQYPLPAMHLEESSIDGTIQVIDAIMREIGATMDEIIEAHGLILAHGDLLTNILTGTVMGSRRNSTDSRSGMKSFVRVPGIFHIKMSVVRLILNEAWGVPNVPAPWSAWTEHTQTLKRKVLSVGWSSKTATPFKPAHEFLLISAAGHVVDAFRIYGLKFKSSNNWDEIITFDEFNEISNTVYSSLFTKMAYNTAKHSNIRDHTFENVILYNLDVLMYVPFVNSIKAGDIGRVVLLLRVWMVMMRAPKTMPKYADVLFETLTQLRNYNPTLRTFYLHNWLVNTTGEPNAFKEVDLLQEHQNFWAKAIYNARGVNRSWKWLSMITVCIYTLRDAMKNVQAMFEIPDYSTKHTIPEMEKEVEAVALALKARNVQEYQPQHSRASVARPRRDLFEEGATVANRKGTFAKFTQDDRCARNMGFTEEATAATTTAVIPNPDGEDTELAELAQYQYQPTVEDLATDLEEPYIYLPTIVDAAQRMAAEDLLSEM